MTRPVLKLYLGDVVELRKTHPCGANEWEIMRLGADVKLRCRGCGRIVVIPRPRLVRRIRKFLARPYDTPSGPGASIEDGPAPNSGGVRT
ncbi:MAG: DUF951 domain-containing protein [Armatimonadetes bacterium]|nr:DUF951 domain-containing protein [Armatimonadota bacterium]